MAALSSRCRHSFHFLLRCSVSDRPFLSFVLPFIRSLSGRFPRHALPVSGKLVAVNVIKKTAFLRQPPALIGRVPHGVISQVFHSSTYLRKRRILLQGSRSNDGCSVAFISTSEQSSEVKLQADPRRTGASSTCSSRGNAGIRTGCVPGGCVGD